MKNYYKIDDWSVIEEGFDPSMQEASESIFSLGNGRMGQRANFEEKYSGHSLQGNYVAGVYYPDKTRVGWWKNGYPEYFAKVLNAPNWIGIHIEIEGQELDLDHVTVLDFRRELNMKQAYLERSFRARLRDGKEVKVASRRFLSIADDETGAIRYSLTPVNFNGKIAFKVFIDGNVRNRDANYDEVFWDIPETGSSKNNGYLLGKTRKSGFLVCMAMAIELKTNGRHEEPSLWNHDATSSCNFYSIDAREGEEVMVEKFVSVLSSMNYEAGEIVEKARVKSGKAKMKGFDSLFEDHRKLWEDKWSHSDIIIEGDPKAQQGIRFNIFHLNQTYTGRDERLNIGPKGFTGEKYGGSTYWDTEAFLVPFYLSTAPQEVARNLLIYRYKHLEKAIENAKKLGFKDGAALYPMVTMNGEECHNEWEITFEEIHRNGAIAFAIYNYIRYTGDESYLHEYGLEVLIAISRFWRQRVNWSDVKGKYVMLGVTGPNEYENNVNNNWYTNRMAAWTLEYTISALETVLEQNPGRYHEILKKVRFDFQKEVNDWKDIIQYMYFPYSETHGIFLQQDGYLDKEQIMAADLDPAERPLNQHWSWDRILRSCFIKQADVLQGIYTFEDEYDTETIRKNYHFYEQRTVHESSLSPCIHSVLACRIGETAQAYNLYLRTSRLDLDDYNHEVDEGLHITSMGGTWMSIVYGFGGMRIKEGQLHFNPLVPENWKSISFRILFRGTALRVRIESGRFEIIRESGPEMEVFMKGKKVKLGEKAVA